MTPEPRDRNRKSTLSNGIRVVTEEIAYLGSVAIGFWAAAGSKDEPPGLAGISHFTEHMLFKGTKTRTAAQLSDAIESVGSQLGAETDKEYTSYSTKVLPEQTELAVEIISDMLTNSLLAPDEFEKERSVLLDEIALYNDSPDDIVHDLMVEALWPNHPLGRPVIGRAETVSAMARDQMLDYIDGAYAPSNLVLSAAGQIEHNRFCAFVERHLGVQGRGRPTEPLEAPKPMQGRLEASRDCEQSYFCFGLPGYRHTDDRKYPLGVLDLVLGRGSSSRLFREIREERGLAYSIGSYSVSYAEGGYLAIAGGCAPANLGQVTELLDGELQNIAKEGPTEAELERAKNQTRVGITFSKDNTGSRMAWIGRSELCYGRYVSYDEVIRKVEAVTKDDVIEAAREAVGDGLYAAAIVGPKQSS
jgi:predicted Zn-dependent peptidase